MNTPVYKAMNLERIVEFKTIFPKSAMPRIKDCIKGFDRDHLFGGLVANMVNKVVKRPFYNPSYQGDESQIDALRFFLSGLNYDLLLWSIEAVEKTARDEDCPLENYVGASEESVLYLLREIMADDEPIVPVPQKMAEKNFFYGAIGL